MIPTSIFCPICSKAIIPREIVDSEIVKIAQKDGFIKIALVTCECGLVGTLNIRGMPERPTYTMAFDRFVPKEG